MDCAGCSRLSPHCLGVHIPSPRPGHPSPPACLPPAFTSCSGLVSAVCWHSEHKGVTPVLTTPLLPLLMGLFVQPASLHYSYTEVIVSPCQQLYGKKEVGDP